MIMNHESSTHWCLCLSLSLFSFLFSRFRSKYHPDESGKRKAEAHAALQNRLNAFQYLMENGWFDNISMDIDRAPQILKILDAGVRKMFTSCCKNTATVID